MEEEEEDDESERSLHIYLPPDDQNTSVNLSDINLGNEEADDEEEEDVFY